MKRSVVLAKLVDWAENMRPFENSGPEQLADLMLQELERLGVVTIKWTDEEDDDNYCGAV